MILPVSLVFGHVTLAASSMTFYDCGAVSGLNQSSQYVSRCTATRQQALSRRSVVQMLTRMFIFQMFGVRHQRVAV